MAEQRQLSLNPQQLSSIVLLESRIMALEVDARQFAQLGAKSLAEAAQKAAEALKAAHDAYLTETQRAVSIAAPEDMARLVKSA